MLKVTVCYSTGQGTTITDRSLIVKTDNYDGEVQADLLSDISLFAPEIRIYSKTLPAMERILKNAGIEEIFWPKLVNQSLFGWTNLPIQLIKFPFQINSLL